MGIQIHELTALNRAPQTGDVLAVDTGTTTNKVDYSALRGAVLTDAVRTDDDQNLTDAQKAQAIENIGAATQADVTAIEDEIGNTALPTTAQTITGAIAEHETDISDVKTTLSGTVKFNVDQSIGSANKARARNNIGAASSDAVETIQNTVNHCVKFSSQTLTDSQKAQARTNIGAASEADTDALETLVGNTTLPTTAQTVTGAIAEHETDISGINSAIGTVPSGSNLQGEVDDLKSAVQLDEKYALLLHDEIPGTTQTVAFDASGNVSTITHTNGNNVAVRTDAFTFATNSIIEVRTLNTGETLTIVTNTTTLATTVTYTAAA